MNKVTFLENELEKRDTVIQPLSDKLDESEQYSRRESCRINGVTEMEVENTDDLVVKVGEAIGVSITVDDINRSHRVGNPERYVGKCRPIIVRFKGYSTKRNFIKNRHKLKNIKTNPSFSSNSCFNKSPIFINDDLTAIRAKLEAELRKLFKERKIQSTWIPKKLISSSQK